MTNLITTGGRQCVDWTADYRLYSQSRIDCEKSLCTGQTGGSQRLNTDKQRLITALDDSLDPQDWQEDSRSQVCP